MLTRSSVAGTFNHWDPSANQMKKRRDGIDLLRRNIKDWRVEDEVQFTLLYVYHLFDV